MGALGWSAGGHWSNWILTHTDRFKAISSGAGTSNWISMYAQSDMQRNRAVLPRRQAAVRRLRRVLEPVTAQVHQEREDAHDDPRGGGRPARAAPAGEELHMALKKLGVPTELFVYPGASPRHPGSAQPAT